MIIDSVARCANDSPFPLLHCIAVLVVSLRPAPCGFEGASVSLTCCTVKVLAWEKILNIHREANHHTPPMTTTE